MQYYSMVLLKDGSYTIIINAHLSHEEQQKVYIHELSHIYENDFENLCADEIESHSHIQCHSYEVMTQKH